MKRDRNSRKAYFWKRAKLVHWARFQRGLTAAIAEEGTPQWTAQKYLHLKSTSGRCQSCGHEPRFRVGESKARRPLVFLGPDGRRWAGSAIRRGASTDELDRLVSESRALCEYCWRNGHPPKRRGRTTTS